MAANPVEIEEFKKALRGYAKRTVPTIFKDAQAIVAMELYKAILETTPVLTSRARHNWFPTFNAPTDESTEETSGLKETDTGVPMTSKERARMQALLRNIHMGTGDGYDIKIYITNNLPYIKGLDDGRSLKAPVGIVEPAVQIALGRVERRVANLPSTMGGISLGPLRRIS